MLPRAFTLFLLIIISWTVAQAQRDSLIFNNGNYIIGEVKQMDRGVVVVETDFSDSDFKIEWSGIAEIYTETAFLLTLSDGRRFNGRLQSTETGRVEILRLEGDAIETTLDTIVFLDSVDETFLSRLYAAIDLGFSFTKARNLRQFNVSAAAGYAARRWGGDLHYSFVSSNQDEVDPIRRGDGGISFRYYLPKDWYALASINFLSSTEQKLNLRSTGKVGIGKYLIHTNQTYWGVAGGLNVNNEDYTTNENDRNSLEGFFGSELNMYDVGDLNLLARAVVYPSFTESGRWRIDLGTDVKYDLPYDFYVRFGFNLNYDNRPVEGAGETDYTFQFGVGWEW